MSWILAILILSGPAKGSHVELVEYRDRPSYCAEVAADLNRQNDGAADNGHRIKFVCVSEAEIKK